MVFQGLLGVLTGASDQSTRKQLTAVQPRMLVVTTDSRHELNVGSRMNLRVNPLSLVDIAYVCLHGELLYWQRYSTCCRARWWDRRWIDTRIRGRNGGGERTKSTLARD